MRAKQITAGDYSDHDTGLIAIHHRQSTNTLQHHVVGRIAESTVLISDRRRALDCLGDNFIVGVSGIQNVSSRDETYQQ